MGSVGAVAVANWGPLIKLVFHTKQEKGFGGVRLMNDQVVDQIDFKDSCLKEGDSE